jgi:hypothetical protein
VSRGNFYNIALELDPALVPPYDIEPLRASIFNQERVTVARMRHEAIVLEEERRQE